MDKTNPIPIPPPFTGLGEDITPQKRPFTPSPTTNANAIAASLDNNSSKAQDLEPTTTIRLSNYNDNHTHTINQSAIASITQLSSSSSRPITIPYKSSISYPSASSVTSPAGFKGLNNLGNTCFMNSALQCLSATTLLTAFFLNGDWVHQVNTTNPLGMEGQVPKMYADLLDNLWLLNGHLTAFAPRDMKYLIGVRNPAFVGYGQQDSQELLGFLLDGLHEDLNRIQSRAYIEDPDYDPSTMTEDHFAGICWETYKKRNDSIIVDLFQGQLKSRLECQVCFRVSVKFDAYMYLQLPIPEPTTRLLIVYAFQSPDLIRDAVNDVAKQFPDIPRHDSGIVVEASVTEDARNSYLDWLERTKEVLKEHRIRKISVKVPRNGTIYDLKKAVAEYMNWPAESTHQASCSDIFNSRIFKEFTDYEPISSLSPNDLLYLCPLYSIQALKSLPDLGAAIPDSSLTENQDELTAPPEVVAVASSVTFWDEGGKKEILVPMTISLPSRISVPGHLGQKALGALLYKILVKRLAPFSSIPLFRRVGSTVLLDQLLEGSLPSADIFNISFFPVVGEDWEPLPGMFYISVRGDWVYPTHAEKKEEEVVVASPKSDTSELLLARQLERNGSIEGGMQDELGDPILDLPPVQQHVPKDEESLVFSHDTDLVIRVSFDEAVEKRLFSEKTEQPYSYTSSYSHRDMGNFTAISDSSLANEEESGKPLSLADCMTEFTKEELLEGNDCFYCSKCKEHQPTKKKLSVFSLPDVLVIHLKRFSNSGRYSSSRSKLEVFVDAPEMGLDMSLLTPTKSAGGALYDLFAVSNHFGGLGGGHYTAYAKNPLDGKWYNCDDSHVSEMSGEKLITKAAYLLFYQKRTLKTVDLPKIIKEASVKAAERQEEASRRKQLEEEEAERKRKEEGEMFRSRSLVHFESYNSLKREPSASTLEDNTNDTEAESVPGSFREFEASVLSKTVVAEAQDTPDEDGAKVFITEFP